MDNCNINSTDPMEKMIYNREQYLEQSDNLGHGLNMIDVAFLEIKDITVKQEPLSEDEETDSTSAVKKNTKERELLATDKVISSSDGASLATRRETGESHPSDESCPPPSVCKVNFKCSECPFQTTEEGLLEEHWRTHSSQIGLSDLLQSFVSNSEVFTGKVDDKAEVKRFNCNLRVNCLFKTNDKQLFDDHCKERHSEDNKKYRCGHCSFRTRYPSNLNLHLIRHTDKRYQCPHCHFSTLAKTWYLKHVKVHSDKHYVQCTKCDKKIFKGKLEAHMLAHAGIYKFACSECDYKTNIKSTLKLHVLTHSNVKLYKCSLCDYTSNHRSQLRFHQLDHEGVKKFKCSHCDYQTNRKYNLNTHAFIHKPTKRFKCDICGHETNRKYNLELHIRKHPNSEKDNKENTSGNEEEGDDTTCKENREEGEEEKKSGRRKGAKRKKKESSASEGT